MHAGVRTHRPHSIYNSCQLTARHFGGIPYLLIYINTVLIVNVEILETLIKLPEKAKTVNNADKAPTKTRYFAAVQRRKLPYANTKLLCDEL